MCGCLVPPGRDPVCSSCLQELEDWSDDDDAAGLGVVGDDGDTGD